MTLFGEFKQKRQANASALIAFGIAVNEESPDSLAETIRTGRGPTLFTIGYERRDSDDLIARLVDFDIELLVDVREKPISRKVDFRKNVLAEACRVAGIEYESWPALGSTGHQREQLKESGNIGEFMRRFRDFARRGRSEVVGELGSVVADKRVALMCYERSHHECHRCVVADLVADEVDATVVAIL